MTLTELRYLVAVAETRHFGRAAAACAVTQPTLSAGIKKLEDGLGVQLLERTSKRVALTRVGAQVVARARGVLEQCEGIESLARTNQAPLTGSFRLGVIPTLGPYLLPWWIPALRRRHRELELVLTEDLTDHLLEALRDHRVDAALLALPLDAEGLDSEPVFDEHFWLALPSRDSLAERKRVRQADLDGRRVLLLGEGHCLRDQALDVCAEVDLDPGVEDMRATSLETLYQLVRAGLGCTLLPALAVANRPRDRRVALRPFAKPVPSRRIAMVWRSSFPRVEECRLLAESLRESAPAECLEILGPLAARA